MYWLECQDENILINISKITTIFKQIINENSYKIYLDKYSLFFTDKEMWDKAWESIQTAIMSNGQGIIVIHSVNYQDWLNEQRINY